MDKKREYLDWLARHRKAKTKLAAYKCPGCSITLETLTPPKGDVYDSLVVCPFCENKHYKKVTPVGKVQVN